ncbi:MAG: hypothetical protein HYV63_13180 [Candidatus Schekmanbacteria bacterium]|nr:hypothetical protein [Candidatus Schekmanbacteria bacterium]
MPIPTSVVETFPEMTGHRAGLAALSAAGMAVSPALRLFSERFEPFLRQYAEFCVELRGGAVSMTVAGKAHDAAYRDACRGLLVASGCGAFDAAFVGLCRRYYRATLGMKLEGEDLADAEVSAYFSADLAPEVVFDRLARFVPWEPAMLDGLVAVCDEVGAGTARGVGLDLRHGVVERVRAYMQVPAGPVLARGGALDRLLAGWGQVRDAFVPLAAALAAKARREVLVSVYLSRSPATSVKLLLLDVPVAEARAVLAATAGFDGELTRLDAVVAALDAPVISALGLGWAGDRPGMKAYFLRQARRQGGAR